MLSPSVPSLFSLAQAFVLSAVGFAPLPMTSLGQVVTAPEIEVLGLYGDPMVSGQGTVELKASFGLARPVVITVRNLGNAPLTQVSAALSSTDEFVINYPLPETIAPGEVGELTLTMLPETANPSSVLTITSNDADEQATSIQLTGQLHAGGPLLVVKRKGSFEVPVHGADYSTPPAGTTAGVVYPGERLQLMNYGDEDLVGLVAEIPTNPGGSGPSFEGTTTLAPEGRTELQLPTTTPTHPELLRIYDSATAPPHLIPIYTQPPVNIVGPNSPLNVVSITQGTTFPLREQDLNLSSPSGPPVNPLSPFTTRLDLRLGEGDHPAAVIGARMGVSYMHGIFRGFELRAGPAHIQGFPAYIAASVPHSSVGISFDGSSHIRQVLASGESTEWFMECWARPLSGSGTQCLVYKGLAGVNGWGICQVEQEFRARLGGAGDVGSFTFTQGEWVHLAVVNKDGVTTFYANGVQAGPSSTLSANPSTQPVYVGSTSTGTDYFTGEMDEVRYGEIKPMFDPALHLQSTTSPPLSLTHGGTAVGQTLELLPQIVGYSKTTDLSLLNISPFTLSGLSVTFEGPNASDFAVAPALPASLTPFSTHAMSLVFSPAAFGVRTATLRIAHPRMPNGILVQLSGIGQLAPDIDVEGLPSGASTLSFTQVTDAGENIQEVKKLNLRNLGLGELNSLSARIYGTHAANFQVSSPLPGALAPSANVEVILTYTPTDQYAKEAVLELVSNDLDETPYTIALTGPGSGALVVDVPEKERLLQRQEILNFTYLPTRSLTLRNEGQSHLTGVTARISGPHASDFSITGPPAEEVSHQASSSTALGITFAASAAGIRQARLLISSSDPNQNPFEVELIGRGISAPTELEVTDTLSLQQLASGSSVQVGGSHDELGRPIIGKRRLIVHNRSNGPLSGLSASISQTGDSLGARWLGPDTLQPNQGGQLECSYDPGMTGTRGAVLLSSSSTRHSPFIIKLKGYSAGVGRLGIRMPGGSFVSMGAVFSCPPTAVGKSSQLKLEVMNQDSEPLAAVPLSGFSEEFGISPKILPKLNPGARTTLTVTFRPARAGVRPAFHVSILHVLNHSFYVAGVGVERPAFPPPPAQSHVLALGSAVTLAPAPQPEDLSLHVIEGMRLPQYHYQWLRNGKAVPGATQPSLDLSHVKLSDGGRYDMVISNEAGTQRLPVATLVVVDKTLRAKPRVVALGQKTTISAILSDPGLASCDWDVAESSAFLTSGPSSMVVSFATPGRHAVSARVASPVGASSVATDPLFIDVVSAAPSPIAPGPQSWTAHDSVSLQIQTSGIVSAYGMSGQPPGLVISPAGLITGRPTRSGQFTVKLWASNPAGRSQVVSMPVIVLPMERGMIGRFVGSFGMHPELNDQLGGSFKLDTTLTAGFTASLQQGARIWKLSGRFDHVSNVNGMSFERWLSLDEVPNAIRLRVQVTPDSAAVATWQVGDHSLQAIAVRRSSAPRGTAGRYNFLSEVAPLQRDIMTETPETVGFITAVVDESANVTFRGRMADGEAITGSSIWAASGASPFHQRLYGAAGGSANGHFIIQPSTSLGRLHWVRKPNAQADLYADGWNPLALDLTGGRFTPPTIAQVIEALTRPRPIAPQVRIEFSGGGLQQGLIGRLKPSLEGLTVQSAAASISGLKLSYAWMTTGRLSGSFRVDTGHHVVFYALEIQTSSQIVGLCKVTQPDGSVLLGSVVVYTDPEL